jgi:hypothetical protein
MTEAKENEHEIWYMECKKSVWGRFPHESCERNIRIEVRFSGRTGDGMEVALNQQVNIHFSVEKGM